MNNKRIALWIGVAGLIAAGASLIVFSQTGPSWAIGATIIAVFLIFAILMGLGIKNWLGL